MAARDFHRRDVAGKLREGRVLSCDGRRTQIVVLLVVADP